MIVLSAPALAEKLVYTPDAEEGEWEFETNALYDFNHNDKTKNALQEYHQAIGYGVNSFWHTELELEDETLPTDTSITSFQATHIEWENIFQFTPKGEYWLDTGMYLAYEAPVTHGQPGQFEGKILLEKDIHKWTNVLNISFNQETGAERDPDTDSGIAWSTRYRFNRYIQPGFEYWIDFPEMSGDSTYNDQNHQIGPVIYGDLWGHLKYDIGYLFGISQAAPHRELKWNLEYEF
jgi:hypothetical protein